MRATKQRAMATGENLQAGAASPEIRGLFFWGRERAMAKMNNLEPET